MENTINIWSAILLLGVFNGVLIIGYLIFTGRIKKREDRILSLFLFTLILITLENIIEYSGSFSTLPHLMYITAPLIFCIGPLLYFYHLEKFDRMEKSNYKYLLHFIPAVVIFFYMLQFYLLPADSKLKYFTNFHDASDRVIGPRHIVVMILFLLQIISYLFFSMNKFKLFSKEIKKESANSIIEQFRGLNALYVFLVLIFTFSFLTQIFLLYDSHYYEVVDRLESVIFSFLIHGTLLMMIAFPSNTVLPISERDEENISEEDEQLGNIKSKILKIMREEELFLNPNLRLDNIAEKINESRHLTSRVINTNLGQNFYDFVNNYRIEKAKELLQSEESKTKSLDSIAFDSGFNSYISFYRVFKRFTKKSPSEFTK